MFIFVIVVCHSSVGYSAWLLTKRPVVRAHLAELHAPVQRSLPHLPELCAYVIIVCHSSVGYSAWLLTKRPVVRVHLAELHARIQRPLPTCLSATVHPLSAIAQLATALGC